MKSQKLSNFHYGNKDLPLDRYPYMENDLKSNGGIAALFERVNTLEEKQKTKWYVLSAEDKNVIFDTLDEDIACFRFAVFKITGNVVNKHFNWDILTPLEIDTIGFEVGLIKSEFFNCAYEVFISRFAHCTLTSNGKIYLNNFGKPDSVSGISNFSGTYVYTDEKIENLKNLLEPFKVDGHD